MAPGRMSTRRTQHDQHPPTRSADPEGNNNVVNEELFLEPMMGTPLAMYIEKDVHDRDVLVDIITVSVKVTFCITRRVFGIERRSFLWRLCNSTIFGHPRQGADFLSQKHGGSVSPGYSGVPYILGKCHDCSVSLTELLSQAGRMFRIILLVILTVHFLYS
jgi:hypothetical protein